MRLMLILLVACVTMAALQYALVALLIVLAITILWGAYAHPAELLSTFAFFLLASVVTHHTVACLALGGFLGFWWIARRPDIQSEPDQNDSTQTKESSRPPTKVP